MDKDKILFLALYWWNLAGNPVLTINAIDEIEAVTVFIRKVQTIIENQAIWE